MNNLNIALALVIGTILTPLSIAQTNAVPPSGSPPPPPLDEGQTWEDWTNSWDYKVITIRSSENPVTNVVYKSFSDQTNAPTPPTDEELEYARIWTKPQPHIVHLCVVPKVEVEADPRFIIKAYTNLLNGEVAEITIRLPSDTGFVQTSVVK